LRSLEILLLLANLLTLLGLAVPQVRRKHWMRSIAVAALPLVILQISIEGPRWQMIPAYLLSGVLFMVSQWWKGRSREETAHRRPIVIVAIALGVTGLVLTLVLAMALPMLVPVFRFPLPTGPYGIGTVAHYWVDTSRAGIAAAELQRELVVQVWYPAKRDTEAVPAAYLPDAGVVTAAMARIHTLPAFIFGHVKYVKTHAIRLAPVASDQARYPVLLFLEGATGYRQMSTYQVEELVSHGYVVASIDQPGAAAVVVLKDGREAAGLTLAQFADTVRPSYLPDQRAPMLNNRAMEGGSIVPYLARDVSFVLDRLSALNHADPTNTLTGRLDLQRAGAFGVSLGGIVVGESCRVEPRLQACLMMDAPMPLTVVKSGLRQPSMWITRDVASMQLERQRTGGWPESEIAAHQSTM
jgi:predicted dienelactone hydrolase